MTKAFLEVFPTLKLPMELKELLEEVQVLRISSTKQRDFLRIYIESRRLIEKEKIVRTEQEIKKQLFPANYITVKIYERFLLSGQYTPKKLFFAYRESILFELKEYSPVLYMMLKKADIQFPEENKVLLTLEDTVTAKMKAEELLNILEKIFHERCGFPVLVQAAYEEKQKKEHEEDDIKIARQVAEIVSRAESSRMESHMDNGENGQEEKKPGETKPQEGRKKEAGASKEGFPGGQKEKRGSFTKRMPKKDPNPDVIYGKDFEEEEILTIDQLIGEMGEVAIRGKVLAVDKREIRNEKTIIIFQITD